MHASLGNYYRRVRDGVKAEEHYRQALELSERNGDVRGRALAIEFLGSLACDQGAVARAKELFREGTDIARGIAPRGDLMIEMLRGA